MAGLGEPNMRFPVGKLLDQVAGDLPGKERICLGPNGRLASVHFQRLRGWDDAPLSACHLNCRRCHLLCVEKKG